MKTVLIGYRLFRLPFIADIPINDDDRANLRESLRVHGILDPVMVWKEKSTYQKPVVIDGANRVELAAELGIVKVPTAKISAKDEDEARAIGRRLNVVRRQLGRDVKQQYLDKIIAASPGLSDGAIAGKAGVARTTVSRRREKLEAAGLDPQRERVGADGKTYPVGEAPGGAMHHLTDQVDAFGNPVPRGLKDALLDPWIQRTIDLLAEQATALRVRRLLDAMKKRAKAFPFIDAAEVIHGLGMIDNTMEAVIQHLKANRPAAVCPKCQGKGCGKCKSSGLVPRSVYEELTK